MTIDAPEFAPRRSVATPRRRPPPAPLRRAAARVCDATCQSAQAGARLVGAVTTPLRAAASLAFGDATPPSRRGYGLDHVGVLGIPERVLVRIGARLWARGTCSAAACILALAWGLYALRFLPLLGLAIGAAALLVVSYLLGGALGLLGALPGELRRAVHQARRHRAARPASPLAPAAAAL